MTSYDLPQFTAVVGTFDIRIYSTQAGLTVPTVETILEIGDRTESIDQSLGVSSFATLNMTIRDDYSTHTEGFWYKILGSGTAYIRILLDDEFFFVGTVQAEASTFNEVSLYNSTYIRIGRLTVVDMMASLFATSTADWIMEILSHQTSMDPGTYSGNTPAKGNKLDVLFASLLYAGGYGINESYATADVSYVVDQDDVFYYDSAGPPNQNATSSLYMLTQFFSGASWGFCDYFNWNDIFTFLTGTVSSSGVNVTGAGTLFTTELAVGDVIQYVDNSVFASMTTTQLRRVATITDNTHLTVDQAFEPDLAALSLLGEYAYDGDTVAEAYWQNISQTAGGIIPMVLRSIGFAIRMDYDASTETATAMGTHKIQLVQRARAYSGTLAFSGREVASDISHAGEMIADSVRIRLKFPLTGAPFAGGDYIWFSKERGDLGGSSVAEPQPDSFDIDYDVLFDVTPIDPDIFTGLELCRMFWVNNAGTYEIPSEVKFLNYETGTLTTVSDSGFLIAFGLYAQAGYIYHRFREGFSRITRLYGQMTADAGSGETFTCLNIGRRTSINDGSGAADYFANRVTLKPMTSQVEIEWVFESN